jgi:hypothetical protein
MKETAYYDDELLSWLLGILNGTPHPAGDFLRSLAQAAMMADPTNYALVRPVLLAVRASYPVYHYNTPAMPKK